jgi:hypothetical protein
MKKHYLFFLSVLAAGLHAPAQGFQTESHIVSTFKELDLAPESFWNGSDGSGGFSSGLIHFYNFHNPEWGVWSGWAYSNIGDNVTPGWVNQYSAITGAGIDSLVDGSVNYAVAYNPINMRFVDPSAHEVKGFFVTNSTFAALSMMHGDDFSKKFGGVDGNDPDWFKLSIWGMRDGYSTDTVEFFLADFRFEDNSMNYIVDTWQWVELSSLGKIDSLMFAMASSDMGSWGMNTPAYFCVDNIFVVPDLPPMVNNPIKDLILNENQSAITIRLADIFSDPDDPDEQITISVIENTSAELAEVVIDHHLMNLVIHENKFGESFITLEALSNGKTVTTSFTVTVLKAISPGNQFVSEVIEYKPGPGQYINKMPFGHPDAANSVIGGVNGALSLGAFGGYVIFRFDNPVFNHPDNPYGIDFILFGNPMAGFSEPGVVSVMKDVNGNGLPDDTWYELAGSDHFFSGTIGDYRLTYYNPGKEIATDVPWEDQFGNAGYVYAKTFHQQPYYPDKELFPEVAGDNYQLSGTRIDGHIDRSDPSVVRSHQRAFGYTDNHPRGQAPWHIPSNPYSKEKKHAGGDGFDIGWAIDKEGNYVDLDRIHFVKVHTAVLDDAGWLGEISTEITGGIVVEPDSTITGVMDMVVIKDLPPVISVKQFQLEALAFHKGRVQWDKELLWSTDLKGSIIDEQGVLHLTESGELTITASVADNPEIYAQTTTIVLLDNGPTNVPDKKDPDVLIYPNPARHHVRIACADEASIIFYSLDGVVVKKINNYISSTSVNLETFVPGIYIVQVQQNDSIISKRMIIR